MPHLNDTIAAIATPPGEGGIAVVRVSGSSAYTVGKALLRHNRNPAGAVELTPRSVTLFLAVAPENHHVLDEVLALWMPGPHSYTREDVLELQCHGGHAAARAVLDAALSLGVRLANPGEFTLRAYLNGRLDLVQAEAVVDVIRARTDAALGIHAELLAGHLSRVVEEWQQQLGHTLAFLEAHLDFAEEDELEPFSAADSVAQLRSVLEAMRARLGSYAWARISRDGYSVALIGAPNTGKSSLLNALLNENRAIVSETPGTTRDAIDAWIDAHGVPVRVIDTAGLRETGCAVEKEGVVRARAAAAAADLVLLVIDGSRELSPAERREVKTLGVQGKTRAVVNKVDLGRLPAAELENCFSEPALEVSARTGAGLDSLLLAIRARAWGDNGPSGVPSLTRQRHHQCVRSAAEAVDRGIQNLLANDYLEVAASELHGARRHLAELLGWGTPEEVLDAVFADFCIGK